MAQEWTPERRAKFAEDMKFRREQAKKVKVTKDIKVPPVAIDEPVVETNQTVEDLKRQIEELKSSFIQVLSNQNQNQGTQTQIGIGNNGKLVGEVEKYAIDSANYSDPTERLKNEPRLQPMAFNYNYELEYDFSVRPYETKTGVNMKEPEFLINLYRIVRDDQGEDTNKRYVAKRLMFHEDPQAAIVVARDNGIDLDEWKDLDNTTDNQRAFLNEMRYLRVKDWLFDIFWPKPVSEKGQVHDEVIGGSIVQVFTKNSVDPSEIEFDKIQRKL